MTVLKKDITERLHAMAFLLDSISSLYNAGIISDEKALERANCFLNHVDDVMKLADDTEVPPI